jgi:hypothetical protein
VAEAETGLRPEARSGLRGPVVARCASRRPAAAAAALAAADVPPPATTRPASVTASVAPVTRSLRPTGRPDDLEQRARATATRQTPGRVRSRAYAGALCGNPGLAGDRLEPITGRSNGCGIAEPVRLRSVDGIALTTPATINCDTARALQTWVREGLVPAVGGTGGRGREPARRGLLRLPDAQFPIGRAAQRTCASATPSTSRGSGWPMAAN